MDKATKAIRRSGTKLRGLSSRHGNLQVLIGQLGDMRTSYKNFVGAQQTAADDLVRWTNDCDNRAIQDTCAYLAELSILWTEVQKDFSERLREYRTQFELILEGERHVDQSRELYCAREQREIKCRKELVKTTSKGAGEEIKLMEERVIQAEKGKDLAYLEVVDRIKENEAVKLIRIREGLRKLSTAYVTMGEKCQAVFSAYHAVASSLPDVHDRNIQEVRYTGSREAALYVQRAKEQVLTFRGSNNSSTTDLRRAESDDISCASNIKLPLSVQLPDQQPGKNSGGSYSKQEEASAAPAPSVDTARHDPPPSYSSVVNDVQDKKSTERGACGYTPSPSYRIAGSTGGPGSLNSSSEAGPIQVSHPAYLNSRTKHASSSSVNIEPASAPGAADADIRNNGSSTEMQPPNSFPCRPLSRSISDRRVLSESRNSMHPMLRQQEGVAHTTTRPYSEYSDLPNSQMMALRLEKPQKKLSLKSLSFAGSTISGLLGLNGSNGMGVGGTSGNSTRTQANRATDSDCYESYDFSNSARNTNERYQQSYSDIHGVLPEELDRVSSSPASTSANKSSSSSQNSVSSVHSSSNDKSRALSAKFGVGIPGAGECREELSMPSCLAAGDMQEPEAAAGAVTAAMVKTSSKAAAGTSKRHRRREMEKKPPAAAMAETDVKDRDVSSPQCKAARTTAIVETVDNTEVTQDLIDLNASIEENSNVTNLLNSCNILAIKSEDTASDNSSSNSSIDNKLEQTIGISSTYKKGEPTNGSCNNTDSTVNTIKITTVAQSLPTVDSPSSRNRQQNSATTTASSSTPLDGDLSSLARPRAGLRPSNPFYEDCLSDESESDTSNSASGNR